MKIFCAITSYERPGALYSLVESLFSQAREQDVDIITVVYDDASISDEMFQTSKHLMNLGVSFVRPFGDAWQGKCGFWRIINHILKDSRRYRFDRFLLLQDDLVVAPYFFERAERTFSLLPPKRRATLNVLMDERRAGKKVWTEHRPRRVVLSREPNRVEANLTGWVDCMFYAGGDLPAMLGHEVRPISVQRWRHDPRLSSGVGQQISLRLYRAGFQLWQATPTLVYHGDHESLMNPLERRQNPLTAHPP